MGDLSPITGKLGRLLPRLASDRDGEVLATVAAIRRTLTREGFDLHDLAARLSDAAPARRAAPTPPEGAAPLAMAAWLDRHARHRLSPKEAAFVAAAHRLLTTRRTLSLKQMAWLRDLYGRHAEGGA